MPLQSSGAISFSQIQTEFGGANPVAMTEYYGRPSIPAAGVISASNFYGANGYNGPASPRTFTASTTLTAGVDFPAGHTITVCMVGAAGSGGVTSSYGKNGGGSAGTVVSTTTSAIYGASVGVTIGAGGTARFGDTTRAGLAGGGSAFNGISAPGGAGGTVLPGDGATGSAPIHSGNGGGKTTCGGSGVDGVLQSSHAHVTGWGGESSGFGNGGFGRVNLTAGDAGSGGVGSGGGGVADGLSARSSGAGGRGEVRISWVL